MLKGKNVLLGITGGIAAYKAAELVSLLIKQHANVDVIMTENATEFITPLTFEQLTGNKVYTDTFDRNFVHKVEHISLAEKADILVIAPATANIIAKLANGIADDMLTTTSLACKCKKLIAPAMNTNMYTNIVTQKNINKLEEYSWEIISPASGMLACGSEGIGKLQDPGIIMQYIMKHIAFDKKDLVGKTVLVTAGPTQESIDPVRYITNHSTGKMGYAIAKMAMLRGARVILVTGETSIEPPKFVEVHKIKSANDMFDIISEEYMQADIIIKAAAVADYTPVYYSDNKVKKKDDDLSIKLKRTIDILNWLGHRKINSEDKKQVIVGFSMETENMLENSKKKLEKKNIDMICANNLKVDGAGFGTDTNIITLITKNSTEELPIMSKEDAANRILSEALFIGKLK